MSPQDLALLLELGLVAELSPGVFELTGPGRIMAGETGRRPETKDTQQYREGVLAKTTAHMKRNSQLRIVR